MTTDRERRLHLKVSTAEREIGAARLRLRTILLEGGNTVAIRVEIENLMARADEAKAEIAKIAAADARARAERLSTLSISIAEAAGDQVNAALAQLRPPASLKTFTKESNL